MSGAAAVFAAVVAAARLGLEVNVTGWLALAENMPGGGATRPGDVLRMYSGKTVEVLNTDAEGRLVLADALARASEEKPDAIVDVATLTGAMVLALGDRRFGIMANDDGFRTAVHTTALAEGEDSWPMPLPQQLRKTMDSPTADIANMGERMGGGLVAGLFLREFVGEGITWAHLDIAGPAFNEGAPVRLHPQGRHRLRGAHPGGAGPADRRRRPALIAPSDPVHPPSRVRCVTCGPRRHAGGRTRCSHRQARWPARPREVRRCGLGTTGPPLETKRPNHSRRPVMVDRLRRTHAWRT